MRLLLVPSSLASTLSCSRFLCVSPSCFIGIDVSVGSSQIVLTLNALSLMLHLLKVRKQFIWPYYHNLENFRCQKIFVVIKK